MPTDQEKCEELIDEFPFLEDPVVREYESTIYNNRQAVLVAELIEKTTEGSTNKKVNIRLPGLKAALRSHTQYGFGHPLERDGVRWEFRKAPPMGSYFSSSSSSDSTG